MWVAYRTSPTTDPPGTKGNVADHPSYHCTGPRPTVIGKRSLVLFGVSNVLGDVIESAELAGYRVTAVVMNQPVDSRPRTIPLSERLQRLDRPPTLVSLEAFHPSEGEVYFIGTTSPAKGQLVEEVRTRFGIRFCNLVHPTAFVSSCCTLGEGLFIGANSAIASGCHIEDHVFINRGVTVGHDTRIGRFSRLSPGCNVAGAVEVGAACTLGMGCNVIEELKIGDASIVGAGAVVIRDVPANTLVVGVPAQVKKTLGSASTGSLERRSSSPS